MKNSAGPAFPRFFILISILTALLLLAGCAVPSQSPVSTGAPTPDMSAQIATAVASAVANPPASSVPTLEPAAEGGKVILVAGEGDQAALSPVLNDLAGKSGWTVETVTELTPGGLRADVKAVVMASAPANLAQLLQAAPQTPFIVISQAALDQKDPNLTVITSQREDEAFVAGYVAELVTDRIGPLALLPSDSPDLNRLQDGFVTGAQLFCGACRLIPNFEQIGPLVAAQPAGSDPSVWQSAIAQAAKYGPDVIYLPAEVSTPALLSYLASQNVRVIGSIPVPGELKDKWVATVSTGLGETIQDVWPDAIAGKGGKQVSARVSVTDIQSKWLTAGRQRLLEETQRQLEQGLISPVTITP